MIKIKRNLDIQKVRQSHSDIVHDESRLLGSSVKSVFTSNDLINWLFEHHNPTNAGKEGIEKLINEELLDPTLPHQLLYKIEIGLKNNFFRFIDDQFAEYKRDATIINLFGIETSSFRFFYEQEEDMSIFKVTEQLNEVLQQIHTNFVHENGTKVNYDGLLESQLFDTQYIPLAAKLAYLDLSPLISNENQLKAFFINVYNAFAMHVLLARYMTRKKIEISTIERLDTFNIYKYNLGGHNYTLNDILHGILRGNDSAGASVPAVAMQYMFKSKSKTPRFKETDPRYKFVLRNLDPRIHFSLNYGAISCPPLRCYNALEIDGQLERATNEFCKGDCVIKEEKTKKFVFVSQLFKHYYTDFGTKDADILLFFARHVEDEGISEELKKLSEQGKNINLEFKKFDINTNIYKSSPAS